MIKHYTTTQSKSNAIQPPPLFSDTAKNVEQKGNGEEKDSIVDTCIIKVKNANEDEKVCRICHMSGDELSENVRNVNLVQLGCTCKGELGVSHYECALAWFNQKGNRTCEICGKPAKNIQGIEDGFQTVGSVTISINSENGDERRRYFIYFICPAIFFLVTYILEALWHW